MLDKFIKYAYNKRQHYRILIVGSNYGRCYGGYYIWKRFKFWDRILTILNYVKTRT